MSLFDELISNLQAQINIGNNFSNFLESIDLFCEESLPIFISAGLSKAYAQAFLLKIANFLTGKYQYRNCHEYIISSPYSLLVDPSNGCPLHCPGCLHNATFENKIGPDWPNGLLDEGIFTSFIEKFGPYASSISFFNWGEPLLNRYTPTFIGQAKKFLLHASLSSNLSVKFDVEALVSSGLDYMILSIDGATPETYGHYRRGGNFDLVIDNVRHLVEAKRKNKKTTPWLCWHFLLFEHNKHEMELAKNMAEELGVDAIKFSLPYDVIWQRDVQLAQNVQESKYTFTDSVENNAVTDPQISKLFSDVFLQKWSDKLELIDEGLCEKRSGSTCQWLYSTLVMDALGRYLPCCYVPRKHSGFTYVFGKPDERQAASSYSIFNTEYYRFSRKHFAWLSELKRQDGTAPMLGDEKHATYCVACPNKDLAPLVNDLDLKCYLKKMDKACILSDESTEIISKWK